MYEITQPLGRFVLVDYALSKRAVEMPASIDIFIIQDAYFANFYEIDRNFLCDG